MAKKKTYQIPFDDEGNLMSYPSREYKRDPDTGAQRMWVPNLRDNFEFVATMTYHGFDNGIRSAHRIIWKDEEGRTYPMFISRFGEALEAHGMDGSTMTGRWTFMKQGQNFSLRAVKPDKRKKAKKRKTQKTKTIKDSVVSASAYASLREERTYLQKVIGTWDEVCAEVLTEPIHSYIARRVQKKVKPK